jgi:hypothetical protein
MKRITLKIQLSFIAFLLFQAGFPVKADGQETLHGHGPAAVARPGFKPIRPPEETTPLELAFGSPLPNKEKLNNLNKQIYDPKSLNYHHYLPLSNLPRSLDRRKMTIKRLRVSPKRSD